MPEPTRASRLPVAALTVALVALAVAAAALVAALAALRDSDEASSAAPSVDLAEAAADRPEPVEYPPSSGNASAVATDESSLPPARQDAGAAGDPPPPTAGDTEATVPPEPAPDDAPAGEPYEFGPAEGTGLRIVGVRYDDVLNLRDAPFGEIIATLQESLGEDWSLYIGDPATGEEVGWVHPGEIFATGRSWKLPTAVWHEVRVGDFLGWASGAYLAAMGHDYDREITSQVLDAIGSVPGAATLDELGKTVAEALAAQEKPARIVTVDTLGVFEGWAAVHVDMLDVRDDSRRGYRLAMTAGPSWESPDDADLMIVEPDYYTLGRVWSTPICHSHRGVSPDGICL